MRTHYIRTAKGTYEIDPVRTGERIRKIMEIRNLDNHRAAGMIYSSEANMKRWTYGTTFPSVDSFYLLSRLLQVEMEDLIVLKGESDRREKKILERISGEDYTAERPPMTNISVAFSRNMKAEMYRRGITGCDIAKKLGVSNAAVSCWILRKSLPSIENLSMVCSLFHRSMRSMLTIQRPKRR